MLPQGAEHRPGWGDASELASGSGGLLPSSGWVVLTAAVLLRWAAGPSSQGNGFAQ